jgi:uncharacterized MAPEG superfamily protein
MRAHANCIENLPVYGAVVVAIVASGVSSPVLDALAISLLVARVCQTTVHIAFQPTTTAVGVRFAFFLIQAVCTFWMGLSVALRAS